MQAQKPAYKREMTFQAQKQEQAPVEIQPMHIAPLEFDAALLPKPEEVEYRPEPNQMVE